MGNDDLFWMIMASSGPIPRYQKGTTDNHGSKAAHDCPRSTGLSCVDVILINGEYVEDSFDTGKRPSKSVYNFILQSQHAERLGQKLHKAIMEGEYDINDPDLQPFIHIFKPKNGND